MKVNINQKKGEEALNNFLKLTQKKETLKERHRRIKKEVLKEVFG